MLKARDKYVIQQYDKGWKNRKVVLNEESAKEVARLCWENDYPYHSHPVRVKRIVVAC